MANDNHILLWHLYFGTIFEMHIFPAGILAFRLQLFHYMQRIKLEVILLIEPGTLKNC